MGSSSASSKSDAVERFPLWEEPRIRLWDRLSQGAIAAAGAWFGYQLTADILIAARYSERGIVVRLARKTKPTSATEQTQWDNEIKITEHFLGMGRSTPWTKREDDSARGAAIVYEDFQQ